MREIKGCRKIITILLLVVILFITSSDIAMGMFNRRK